jgi:hypothetical protein
MAEGEWYYESDGGTFWDGSHWRKAAKTHYLIHRKSGTRIDCRGKKQALALVKHINQIEARSLLPAVPQAPVLPESSHPSYRWVSILDPAVRPEHSQEQPEHPFEELRFADPVKLMGYFQQWLTKLEMEVETISGNHYFYFHFHIESGGVRANAKVRMLLTASEILDNVMFLQGDFRWQKRALCCLLANKIVEQSSSVTVLEFSTLM